MNLIPMHADVWVIEQEHVFLFRQKNQQWTEELKLPYEEFSGSAVALSSFSLLDTAVYLNVFQQTSTSKFWSENRWALQKTRSELSTQQPPPFINRCWLN
jgi:N-acetylneuraminic acid mutarotase